MKNVYAIYENQSACDQVEKLSIDTALQRNWTIPHRAIHVTVADNKVTLSGTVHTKHAYMEAEKIATQTPGVFSVSNNMRVTE